MSRPQPKLEQVASPLVPRSELAASDIAIYATRPSESVILRFLDHVRVTGMPETFPTICRTPPPAGSPPRFLRRFDVDRKLRPDGDLAPCAICSPFSPKFLHNGYFAWYPQEAVIRAIGPECGDAYFGGTLYAEALAQFNHDERERIAVTFLENNLRKVLDMVVVLEAIRPAARAAEALHTAFKTRAPLIHAQLRRLKTEGGALKVTAVIDKGEADEDRIGGPRGFGKSDSDYDSHDIVFGHLPDTTILQKQFDPMGQLRAMQNILIYMPRFESEEEAFYWICECSADLDKLEAICADLRKCSRLYIKLDEDLRRAAAFFSEPLFAALDAWGRHKATSFDLAAVVEQGTFVLKHIYDYPRAEKVELTPDFAALGARGDWPGFE